MNQRGNSERRGLSRRSFLQGAAAIGAGGGLLAACGGDDDAGTSGAASSAAPPGAAAPVGQSGSAPAPAGSAAAGDLAIKIGFVTPTTGALAPFGEADAYVIETMAAILGAGVEIVQKDAESDPGKAGQVTQELLDEGVHLVLAGDTPDITVPVANACALGEIPCITSLAPWQPHYLGTGGDLAASTPAAASDYNFHFFWGLEDVIENFIALWEQSGADKVVGGMWPNDPDGNAWGDAALGFPPALEAAGFTVVDAGRFELDTQDFSAIISQFKDAGVQIVSGVVPPPVFANFQAQALQQGFNPAVITMAKALLFPSAVETYPQGEGLSSEIWWSAEHPFTSSLTGQTAAELAAAYEEGTGKQWTQPLGFAHALFEVAADVAKRAGSTDPAALIEAIKATNLATVVGLVDFSSGPVPNVTKTPLCAGQWVAGTEHPLELAITVNHHIDGLDPDGEITPIAY